MKVFGDVLLSEGSIGGEIHYQDGQPIIDGGLETFFYISLFSNEFWGNELAAENAEKLEEGLDIFSRSKAMEQTRVDILDRAKKLVQPALDIGLADEIDIDVLLEISYIHLTLSVVKNAVARQYKYIINWQNQIESSRMQKV